MSVHEKTLPRSAPADPLRLLPFVPTAARRILDFGCGAGQRLRALKERGAGEVVGVDTVAPDPEASGAARVHTGALDTIEPPYDAGYFDCILSDGALARLRGPSRVLARFRNLLAPGGLLVLSAPNVQYHRVFSMLVEGRWTYAPEGPFPRGQIRFYTGYELHKLLGACGFTGVKLTGLEIDDAEAFPLGEDGQVRMGRISVGPLAEGDHAPFLVREYLVLGRVADAEST